MIGALRKLSMASLNDPTPGRIKASAFSSSSGRSDTTYGHLPRHAAHFRRKHRKRLCKRTWFISRKSCETQRLENELHAEADAEEQLTLVNHTVYELIKLRAA
jgi:hypothetical protein